MRLFFVSFITLCQLTASASEPAVGSRVYLKTDLASSSCESGVDTRAKLFSKVVRRREGEFLWVGTTRLHASEVVSPEEALRRYEDQIRQTPGNAAAYRSLGAVKCDSGDFAAAIKSLDEAIRMEPEDALPIYLRGIALMQMHAKREIGWRVIDYWHFGPAHLALYFNHEDALSNRRRINRDDSVVNQSSFRMENSLGNRTDEGELERAIQDFTKALRLDPDSVLVTCARGIAWNNMGDFDKAQIDLAAAIIRAPKAHYPLQCRALIQAYCLDKSCRDPDQAILNARQACVLTGWKDAESISFLAAIYAESGDFDAALHWASVSAELAPENKRENEERLKCYRARKPFTELTSAFHRK